jgi:hypothetical protein
MDAFGQSISIFRYHDDILLADVIASTELISLAAYLNTLYFMKKILLTSMAFSLSDIDEADIYFYITIVIYGIGLHYRLFTLIF